MSAKLVVHTDGGSRGNPGPAAAGFVIDDANGQRLLARAFFLGKSTNNVAEYSALVKALEAAKEIGGEQLAVFTDSELMVRQIAGRYKVKSELIRPLFDQVQALRRDFARCDVIHVRREKNKDADRLVNEALDVGGDVDESPASTAPSSSSGKRLRLGVLLSGGGRTMLNILEEIHGQRLDAEIVLVISSRSTVAGVKRARDAGLPVEIVRKKDYPDIDAFRQIVASEIA